MVKTLPFDELNTFQKALEDEITLYGKVSTPKKVFDTVSDILLYIYLLGYDAVNETFGTALKPSADKQGDAVFKDIAGKTFLDRIMEYSESGSAEEIVRVAETEMTRVYNQAVLDAGSEYQDKSGRVVNKIWLTQNDERVRDTHSYLEGMEIPLGEEFWTYDGDHALAPGGFENADNNVNCRCQLDIV